MGTGLVEAHYISLQSNSFICNRVEALHLLTTGSNTNTVISGGHDGLIKILEYYYKISR